MHLPSSDLSLALALESAPLHKQAYLSTAHSVLYTVVLYNARHIVYFVANAYLPKTAHIKKYTKCCRPLNRMAELGLRTMVIGKYLGMIHIDNEPLFSSKVHSTFEFGRVCRE